MLLFLRGLLLRLLVILLLLVVLLLFLLVILLLFLLVILLLFLLLFLLVILLLLLLLVNILVLLELLVSVVVLAHVRLRLLLLFCFVNHPTVLPMDETEHSIEIEPTEGITFGVAQQHATFEVHNVTLQYVAARVISPNPFLFTIEPCECKCRL